MTISYDDHEFVMAAGAQLSQDDRDTLADIAEETAHRVGGEYDVIALMADVWADCGALFTFQLADALRGQCEAWRESKSE